MNLRPQASRFVAQYSEVAASMSGRTWFDHIRYLQLLPAFLYYFHKNLTSLTTESIAPDISLAISSSSFSNISKVTSKYLSVK